MQQKHFKTIVMSDIHLGSKWSKAKEAGRFLKYNTCDELILCGDIIDGWELSRGNKWKRRFTKFIARLLKIQNNTHIVYVRGNHDDFLNSVLPLKFANMEIVNDYVYTSAGKKYFVLHGDIFDTVTTSMRWLAKLGDIGYSILLWFNRIYNERRAKKGLPYYSVSQRVKQKVKASVSYISDFEEHLVQVARSKGCDGVICGHIHQVDMRMIDGIQYLNSGDWVESLTALTEDYEGNWNIFSYEQSEAEDNNTTAIGVKSSDTATEETVISDISGKPAVNGTETVAKAAEMSAVRGSDDNSKKSKLEKNDEMRVGQPRA